MAARTLEIMQPRWAGFLNFLSKNLQDRPIRIEVQGAELGDQWLGAHLPLVGMDYETRGSEAGTMCITVATSQGGELRHHVARPRRLYLRETEAGELECLDIEDEEGMRTLIYLEDLPKLEAPGEWAPVP